MLRLLKGGGLLIMDLHYGFFASSRGLRVESSGLLATEAKALSGYIPIRMYPKFYSIYSRGTLDLNPKPYILLYQNRNFGNSAREIRTLRWLTASYRLLAIGGRSSPTIRGTEEVDLGMWTM